MNERNLFFASVFSKELDRWKKEKNQTQEDFASLTGIHKNSISRYKKGDAYPTEPALGEICRVLDVDSSIFYPHTFEEKFLYDKDFRNVVFADQEAREYDTLREAEIDILFWEFLWRKIPYAKMVMPMCKSNVEYDPVFLKKFSDNIYKISHQDIEFVRQLQNDVTAYITMILMKKALHQRLSEGSEARVVEILFDMAKDLICKLLGL